MTHQPFQVEPMTGRCAATGRVFDEGEEFITALFEDGESFRRQDYGLSAWNGPPEGCFCHFKTRSPVKEKRRKLLVDDDVLLNFFRRLAEETAPVRVQFRFVLALILMRKRLLRYESSQTAERVEVWTMTSVKDQAAHRVVNPHLTDDQIDGVSRELSAILHGDTVQWLDDLEPGETTEQDAAQGSNDNHADDSGEDL